MSELAEKKKNNNNNKKKIIFVKYLARVS